MRRQSSCSEALAQAVKERLRTAISLPYISRRCFLRTRSLPGEAEAEGMIAVTFLRGVVSVSYWSLMGERESRSSFRLLTTIVF